MPTFTVSIFFFFFNDTATTEIYTLSLHDALPILVESAEPDRFDGGLHARVTGHDNYFSVGRAWRPPSKRSEEHTSELQSRRDLVCRLLLEKKKKNKDKDTNKADQDTRTDYSQHAE